MENTYIIANIKLPLKINQDGSLEPMQEFISIEFNKSNNTFVNEKNNIGLATKQLDELISNIISNCIYKSDLVHKKESNNITFKNRYRPIKSSRFSNKFRI
jgi:hypothetical protein